MSPEKQILSLGSVGMEMDVKLAGDTQDLASKASNKPFGPEDIGNLPTPTSSVTDSNTARHQDSIAATPAVLNGESPLSNVETRIEGRKTTELFIEAKELAYQLRTSVQGAVLEPSQFDTHNNQYTSLFGADTNPYKDLNLGMFGNRIKPPPSSSWDGTTTRIFSYIHDSIGLTTEEKTDPISANQRTDLHKTRVFILRYATEQYVEIWTAGSTRIFGREFDCAAIGVVRLGINSENSEMLDTFIEILIELFKREELANNQPRPLVTAADYSSKTEARAQMRIDLRAILAALFTYQISDSDFINGIRLSDSFAFKKNPFLFGQSEEDYVNNLSEYERFETAAQTKTNRAAEVLPNILCLLDE